MKCCGAFPTQILYSGLGTIVEEGVKGWRKPEEQGLAETGSPGNVRGYTHGVSRTWLHKHDLSKDDTNRHDKIKGGSHTASILDKKLQATKEC